MMKEVDPITYDAAVGLKSPESVILWQSNRGCLASIIARDPELLGLFRAWRATWADATGFRCRTMPAVLNVPHRRTRGPKLRHRDPKLSQSGLRPHDMIPYT